jgi:hypothetical protein
MKKYNEKNIVVFDIVGTFFVDTFYNDLYLQSEAAVKAGRAKSITDVYKFNITSYMRGLMTNRKIASKVIKSIHEYYQGCIGVNFISFGDFEDKFLSSFVPAEYYNDFDTTTKDKLLFDIIGKTVQKFTEDVLHLHIKKIIDDHQNRNNVVLLQQTMIDIFTEQRDDYYYRFVKERIKPKDKAKFDNDTMQKLKTAFVDEKKAKIALEADKVKLCQIIKQLNERIEKMQKQIDQYEIDKRKPLPTLNNSSNSFTNSLTSSSYPLSKPEKKILEKKEVKSVVKPVEKVVEEVIEDEKEPETKTVSFANDEEIDSWYQEELAKPKPKRTINTSFFKKPDIEEDSDESS